MPMVPQAAIAMLACARIGAIRSFSDFDITYFDLVLVFLISS